MSKRTTKPKRYFIVNPSGTIHEATYEHCRERLKQVGWRMAMPAEVKAFVSAKGKQVHDQPLAKPWSNEPEPVVEPEGSEEGN